MSLVETLRPTITTEDNAGGGYVLDDANAFDQNPTTFSRVIADGNGESVSQIFLGFPADSYPADRSSVSIEIDLARFEWSTYDRAIVWFQVSGLASWVKVGEFAVADLDVVSGQKTFDVTSLVGNNPATFFAVAVWFGNDYPPPDPPYPEIPT